MEQQSHSAIERTLASADWDVLASVTEGERRFLNRNWYEAWSEAYLPKPGMEGPVRYLVTRDAEGTVLGALPYVLVHLAGLRILSLAGFYYPLRGIPMHAEHLGEICRSMAGALTSSPPAAALRLGPVEADDAAPRMLVDALGSRGWSRQVIDHGPQQIVPLPPTFEQFCETLGRNLRRNIRKGVNRMRRDGEVKIRAMRGLRASEWDRVVEDIGRVEAHSWLAHTPRCAPRFLGERNQRFWKRLLADRETRQGARAWLLYFNGDAVAFTFTIDSGGCRYNLAGQHDEAVDRYDTGWIVDRDMFEDAIGVPGLTVVNLGDGWAHYKSRWGAVSGAPLRDYLVFPPSVKGRLLHLGVRAKRRLRAWRRRGSASPEGPPGSTAAGRTSSNGGGAPTPATE